MFRAILDAVPLTLLLVAAVVLSLAAVLGLVVAVSLVVLMDLSYPFSGDVAIARDDFRSGALSQFFYGP